MRSLLRAMCILALLLARQGLMAQTQGSYAGPFVITGILVEGNKSTMERVIVREMLLQEGDTVLTNEQLYYLIERSRQNVFNMSLFNSVRIVPTYLSEHEVFLTVTVSERWFYWPTPIFKYSDPNFNTWWLTKDFRRVYWGAFLYRYNMRRRNETLYAKVQLGYSKEFALRYRFPYIDKKQRIGLAFGGGYAVQDEITIGTEGNKRKFLKIPGDRTRNEWKGDLEITVRPKHDLKYAFRLNYVSAHVLDTVPRRAPNYFNGPVTHEAYMSVGAFISYDERDSRFFPRDGYYLDLRLDHLGLGVASVNEPELTTFVGTAMRMWRFGDRWTIGGSAKGKVSIGPDLPYYNQVALGYDDYVRGYEYYVTDGEHFVLGKFNVLWALFKPREFVFENMKSENFKTLYLAIYLNAFVDAGRVWDSRYATRNFLNNTWEESTGLGVNVVTSYDQVMRVEYTVNRQNEQTFYLHFAQPF